MLDTRNKPPLKCCAAGNALNDLYRYDVVNGSWANLSESVVDGQPPAPRWAPGLVATAGRLYLFGGAVGDGERTV